MSASLRIAFFTLGCKVNQYDTAELGKIFTGKGCHMAGAGEKADIVIVNTCAVTNVSGKKSRQMISKARKAHENALVVVCGCYAAVAEEEVSAVAGADIVITVRGAAAVAAEIERRLAERGIVLRDNGEGSEVSFGLREKTRCFIKIEDGCDMFCAYCVIPFARGRVQSRPADEVLAEAREAASRGVKEIVLTGIHIASYGKDLHDADTAGNLPSLVRALCGVENLERVRLGSVEPRAVDAEFLAAAAHPKVCGQFHLSLQSGSDAVLRRMNRRYTAKEYADAAERLRRAKPDVLLTTDIIAGFPGETDAEFDETCRFARDVGFLKIHVFPFSPKSGTKAADMPDRVSEGVKAERVKRLMDIGREMSAEIYAERIGRRVDVLFEEADGGYVWGHTANFLRIGVKDAGLSERLVNGIFTVEIVKAEAERAFGIVL